MPRRARTGERRVRLTANLQYLDIKLSYGMQYLDIKVS